MQFCKSCNYFHFHSVTVMLNNIIWIPIMLPMNNSQRPLPSSGSIILLCRFIKFSYNSTNSIVKFYF